MPTTPHPSSPVSVQQEGQGPKAKAVSDACGLIHEARKLLQQAMEKIGGEHAVASALFDASEALGEFRRQVERTLSVPVSADKIREGDVISMCAGFEPDTVVASAEYWGWRNGCNCVRIGFADGDGVRFMPTPGWSDSGVFAPSKLFYVDPSAAAEIVARPHAMDAYYAEVSA